MKAKKKKAVKKLKAKKVVKVAKPAKKLSKPVLKAVKVAVKKTVKEIKKTKRLNEAVKLINFRVTAEEKKQLCNLAQKYTKGRFNKFLRLAIAAYEPTNADLAMYS